MSDEAISQHKKMAMGDIKTTRKEFRKGGMVDRGSPVEKKDTVHGDPTAAKSFKKGGGASRRGK